MRKFRPIDKENIEKRNEEIRELYPRFTQEKIAGIFGLSRQWVNHIINNPPEEEEEEDGNTS